MIHDINTLKPRIGAGCFIAWNAEVAGDVEIGCGSSVWFSAVVRGDTERISIGKNVNIQDGAVVHADEGVPCVIEDGVTVGHGAIVHSCTIGKDSTVGMGAVVLNNAKIGSESIVGAGALVTPGKEFPPKSMILGSPARAVRDLTEEETAGMKKNAEHYCRLAAAAGTEYTEHRFPAGEESGRNMEEKP